MRSYDNTYGVMVGNGKFLDITHIGDSEIKCNNNSIWKSMAHFSHVIIQLFNKWSVDEFLSTSTRFGMVTLKNGKLGFFKRLVT